MGKAEGEQGTGRPQQAVVRLRGSRGTAPGVLLEMDERVREPLLLVGVTEVRIEHEADGEEDCRAPAETRTGDRDERDL